MNSASSRSLLEYFHAHTFAQLSTTTSALAITLLVLTAIEREVLRATSPEGNKRNVLAFVVIMVPMVIVFAAVIVARFLRLATA